MRKKNKLYAIKCVYPGATRLFKIGATDEFKAEFQARIECQLAKEIIVREIKEGK